MAYLQNYNLDQWGPRTTRERLAARWRKIKIRPWLRRERAMRKRFSFQPPIFKPKPHIQAPIAPKIAPIVETFKSAYYG